MKILLSIMFVTHLAWAENFKIEGKIISFQEEKGLLLGSCSGQCVARQKIKSAMQVDMSKLRSHQKYISSIGSDICRLYFNAYSVLGVSSNRNQRAFCVFSDDSMLEINSLSEYFLKENLLISP